MHRLFPFIYNRPYRTPVTCVAIYKNLFLQNHVSYVFRVNPLVAQGKSQIGLSVFFRVSAWLTVPICVRLGLNFTNNKLDTHYGC